MIDNNALTEVAWTWAAGAAFPVSSTQLASNCSSLAAQADLAVAPGGDAIAGMNCGTNNSGGDTFVRRIAGSWKTPGSVPIQNLTVAGTCPGAGGESRRGQALSVAIDSTGQPTNVPLGRSSNFHKPTGYYDPTYARLGFRLPGGAQARRVHPAFGESVAGDLR